MEKESKKKAKAPIDDHDQLEVPGRGPDQDLAAAVYAVFNAYMNSEFERINGPLSGSDTEELEDTGISDDKPIIAMSVCRLSPKRPAEKCKEAPANSKKTGSKKAKKTHSIITTRITNCSTY